MMWIKDLSPTHLQCVYSYLYLCMWYSRYMSWYLCVTVWVCTACYLSHRLNTSCAPHLSLCQPARPNKIMTNPQHSPNATLQSLTVTACPHSEQNPQHVSVYLKRSFEEKSGCVADKSQLQLITLLWFQNMKKAKKQQGLKTKCILKFVSGDFTICTATQIPISDTSVLVMCPNKCCRVADAPH